LILLLAAVAFASAGTPLFFAAAGPNSAGTGADDASLGTVAWSNPANITSSDNSRASASVGDASISHYLKATSFGFSIPSGSAINGIVVEYECHNTASAGGAVVEDNSIKLVKGGAISGDDKGDGTDWPFLAASESYLTKGSSSDQWGLSWTATDINASDFGCAISAKPRAGFEVSDAVALIDHVRITVHYTLLLMPRRIIRWDGELDLAATMKLGQPVYRQTRTAAVIRRAA